jgi:hypothetical protein
MNVNVLRSESTGSVHVKSADPAEPPAIRFNFLSARADRDGLLAAIRKGRELMATSPLKEMTGEEIAPGAHLRPTRRSSNGCATTPRRPTIRSAPARWAPIPWPSSTRARVHGIQGLRVADASIMPTLTSGNTNAPCIMIGEKCSEMVLAAAAYGRVQGGRLREGTYRRTGFPNEHFAARAGAPGGNGDHVCLGDRSDYPACRIARRPSCRGRTGFHRRRSREPSSTPRIGRRSACVSCVCMQVRSKAWAPLANESVPTIRRADRPRDNMNSFAGGR